jgi:hypothetical protein
MNPLSALFGWFGHTTVLLLDYYLVSAVCFVMRH